MEAGPSHPVASTSAGGEVADEAGPVPKNASKRGRKKDHSLPPSRSREIQRAFRARKAAQLEWLQNRVRVLEEENNELRRRLGESPRDDIDESMTTPGKLGFKQIADMAVESTPNGQDSDDHHQRQREDSGSTAAPSPEQLAPQPHASHAEWPVQAVSDAAPADAEQQQQQPAVTVEQIHQALTDQVRPMQGRRLLPYRPPAPSIHVELEFLRDACGYGQINPDFAREPFAIFCLALMRGLEVTGKGKLERTSWSMGEQRMLEEGAKTERECCDGLVDCSDPMFDNVTPDGFISVHDAWFMLESYTRPNFDGGGGGGAEPPLPTIPAQALANSILDVGGPGSRFISVNVRLEDDRGLLVYEGAANKVRKAAQAYREMGGPGAWQRKVGKRS